MDYELLTSNALIDVALTELNANVGMDVELRPELTSGKSAHNGNGLGYKLCRQAESPSRTLILILDQYSLDFEGAKRKIKAEVLSFWNGEATDPLRGRRVEY